MNVVVMGTPEFAVPALRAVHQQAQVVGVYTQPDRPVGRGLELKSSPVKKVALELGLQVFQPEKLSLPGEFEKLQALKPDVIVVVAYGQILRKNVLELPPLGCINIHSSLLPRWRGAAPIQWAILEGDTESGITTMKLVEKLDAGDILLQSRTPITNEDTAGTLHDRLSVMGAELIGPTLAGLHAGTLQGQRQNEGLVTYASKLDKAMQSLDFNLSAAVLERQVRALNPWPGTSVWIKSTGERIRIKKVSLRRDIQGPRGHLFERAGMLCLGTNEGSIECLILQLEGKKEVHSAGFLNGLRGRGIALPVELMSKPDAQ